MNFKKTNKILSASLAGLLIMSGWCQAKKRGGTQDNPKIADLNNSKAAEQSSSSSWIKKFLFWSSIIGGSGLAGGAIDRFLLQKNQNSPQPSPVNTTTTPKTTTSATPAITPISNSTAPSQSPLLFTDAKKQLRMEPTEYGYKIETPFATIALFHTLLTNHFKYQYSHLNMIFQLKPGALAAIHHNDCLIKHISSVTTVCRRETTCRGSYNIGSKRWELRDPIRVAELLDALCTMPLDINSFICDLKTDSFLALLAHTEETFNGKQQFELPAASFGSTSMAYFLFALKFGFTDVSENLKYLENRVEFLKSCAPHDYNFNKIEEILDSNIDQHIDRDTVPCNNRLPQPNNSSIFSDELKKELNSTDNITNPSVIIDRMNIVPGHYFIENIEGSAALFYDLRATSAFNYILSDSTRRSEIEQVLKTDEKRFRSNIANSLCRCSDETALYKYLLDGKTIPTKYEKLITKQ